VLIVISLSVPVTAKEMIVIKTSAFAVFSPNFANTRPFANIPRVTGSLERAPCPPNSNTSFNASRNEIFFYFFMGRFYNCI
jgi:hypothetical protein